jgi:hypothetical protein
MAVDAELVCKAIQQVMRDSLATQITAVQAEWAATQALEGWTVPADPLDLPAVASGDIQIGRVDILTTAESNFPAVWIYVEGERPRAIGEQAWVGSDDRLVVRVLAQGMSVAHTSKLIYRYADAVRRTLMQNRTLKTTGLSLEPPEILYVQEEEQGLYAGAQLEFPVATVRAW